MIPNAIDLRLQELEDEVQKLYTHWANHDFSPAQPDKCPPVLPSFGQTVHEKIKKKQRKLLVLIKRVWLSEQYGTQYHSTPGAACGPYSG